MRYFLITLSTYPASGAFLAAELTDVVAAALASPPAASSASKIWLFNRRRSCLEPPLVPVGRGAFVILWKPNKSLDLDDKISVGSLRLLAQAVFIWLTSAARMPKRASSAFNRASCKSIFWFKTAPPVNCSELRLMKCEAVSPSLMIDDLLSGCAKRGS